jgi:glutathione reductase (NADPH)
MVRYAADKPVEIMWYTADVADNIRKAVAYGFGDDETASKMVGKFDWTTLKHKRDDYIKRLNGI